MQLLALTFYMSQHSRLGDESTVRDLPGEVLTFLFSENFWCWECGKIRIPFSEMFPGPTPWPYENPQELEDLDRSYNFFQHKATIHDRSLDSCCQFPIDPDLLYSDLAPTDLCHLMHNTPHNAMRYILKEVEKEYKLPPWKKWRSMCNNLKECARHQGYITNVPGEEEQSTNILTFLRCHIGGADA